MSIERPLLLLADGCGENCRTTEAALGQMGQPCDLKSFEDGLQLMDYLHRCGWLEDFGSEPFLLILDLRLPGINGFETLRQIKTNPRLQTLPVVVCSDMQDREEVMRAYRLGAASVLIRPDNFTAQLELTRLVTEYFLNDARKAGPEAKRMFQ